MKFRNEKNFPTSIRYKWTAYFLVVLLIPLIFNTFSFLFYSDKIQQEINTQNSIFYQNIANELEMDISRYRKISLELGTSPTVRSLANTSSGSTPEEKQINDFQNVLRQYDFYLYNTYNSYVYFENLGMLGSTNGMEDCSAAFQSLYGGFDAEYEEWRDWLSEPYETYWVLESKNNLTDVSSKFTLLKFPLYSNTQQQHTNLIIALRDNYFSYQIEKIINDSQVHIELYDRSDTLMCTTFNSDETTLSIRGHFEANSGLFETELQGTETIVHYTTLPSENWKLVFYTPKNHYYQISRYLNQIAALMLFAVAAGVMLIQFFVRKQYRPLKNIVKSIPSKVKGQNEYLRIQNMLTESLKEHRKNELLHEKHEKNQFDRFLMQILKSSSNLNLVLDDVKKRMAELFGNQPNQLFLIPLDSYTQLFPDEDIPEYERFTLLADMVENVGSEVLAAYHIESYFLESGGNMVVLASVRENCDSYQLNECLEELLGLIKQHLKVSLTIGVSQPCSDWYSLSQAYQEALTCLEYLRLNPENNIVFYEDIAKEQVISYAFSSEDAAPLLRYLQQGERQEACSYMSNQFRRFIQIAGMQSMACQYYIHDVINTLMKNFQPYVSGEAQSSINILHLLSVSQPINASSIQNELEHLITNICDRILQEASLNSESGAKKTSLAHKIKNYIDKNYMDQSLCTESIAQEFGITSTYVSKLFKTIENRGFVNYVNTKRIEKAKQLLINTDKKLDEITEESGFLNTSSFIRLFKSNEGITPGNYRKLHKQKHH